MKKDKQKRTDSLRPTPRKWGFTISTAMGHALVSGVQRVILKGSVFRDSV
jgi:hypothetical protein